MLLKYRWQMGLQRGTAGAKGRLAGSLIGMRPDQESSLHGTLKRPRGRPGVAKSRPKSNQRDATEAGWAHRFTCWRRLMTCPSCTYVCPVQGSVGKSQGSKADWLGGVSSSLRPETGTDGVRGN